ncbi:ribokinase [Flavisphingomonas formosensis]|uniref:ribokinase n=1 Tax=Flavisphingomonas formosensis TaxID=861534 RepID=UPI0022B76A7D|nr:ribokinase [Sphingomonas formosensis]
MLSNVNSKHRIFLMGSLVIACCAKVDRAPEAGESVRATDFVMELGGKGLNVAVAAHRLGVSIDGLFAVGSDRLGSFAREAFAETGLSPKLLVEIEGPTGAGVGLIEAGGDNRIAVFPAANDHLSPAHVEAAADRIADAGILLAQFEIADAPIAAGFALARRAGVQTLLNPSPYRPIAPAILDATDMIVVNETEARALAATLGVDDADGLAHALAPHGIGTLVVTRGAEGARFWHHGETDAQPAFPAEAIDTIGAGDAFIAGLVAALSQGRSVGTALRWGCAAGSIVVTRLGLLDALPSLAELAALTGEGTPAP